MMTGYLHASYADSLAEFGRPRLLPESGGWILEREIPGSSYRDSMGCYPLFACSRWSCLPADLEALRRENALVSLAAVTDPFGDCDVATLRTCFPDVVRPFKEHHIVDLRCHREAFVHPHHRRYARKALQDGVCVEGCADPLRFFDDWTELYAHLIRRHNIHGITAFSRNSFAKQMQVPGLVALRAARDGSTVGMMLWYIQGDIGYYHLGVSSESGYRLRSAFALFWFALEHFASLGLRWLDLGAGAGIGGGGTDGLSRFKQGWSTGTRTAYFCGRIFAPERYEEIAKARGIPTTTDYFPAYRQGEFGHAGTETADQ